MPRPLLCWFHKFWKNFVTKKLWKREKQKEKNVVIQCCSYSASFRLCACKKNIFLCIENMKKKKSANTTKKLIRTRKKKSKTSGRETKTVKILRSTHERETAVRIFLCESGYSRSVCVSHYRNAAEWRSEENFIQ